MKDNQPRLKEAIAELFQPSDEAPESEQEQQKRQQEEDAAQRWDKGHGRVEHRSIRTSTALNNYLDWPGVQQVFELKRTRTIKGESHTEIAYRITSLSPQQADADRLLALSREHWLIENSVHYVRDQTFGEDASQVRTGHAPRLMAAVRNLTISLMNRIGLPNKAAAQRHYAAQPHEALALINAPPEN